MFKSLMWIGVICPTAETHGTTAVHLYLNVQPDINTMTRYKPCFVPFLTGECSPASK